MTDSSTPDELTKLTSRLREAAARGFADTPVVLAYAHGSRIRGEGRAGSDLDIGYYLADDRDGRLPIREEMALAARLSEQLELDVDLRNLGSAPLELRGRVIEEGIRIYCDDEVRRVNLERDVLGRYHDYKEKIRRLHEERLRHFADSGL